LDFDDQRPAQESADDHEHAEHTHITEGRLQRHGPDHVTRHQKLQPQQQRLAQLVLVALIRPFPVELKEIANRAPRDHDLDHAGYDHHGTDDLDDEGRPFDHLANDAYQLVAMHDLISASGGRDTSSIENAPARVHQAPRHRAE